MEREVWSWRDRRTGQQMGMATVRTREQAEAQLDDWLARDRKGGRPDLHEYWPHVEVFRLHPKTD
jgi:hypothetical protein